MSIIRSLSVRGQQGRLKVGYQTAADLGPYSLLPVAPGEWRVEATVKTADAYWMSRGPLTLELSVGAQRWSWRDVSAEVADGSVRCTVTGKPERR